MEKVNLSLVRVSYFLSLFAYGKAMFRLTICVANSEYKGVGVLEGHQSKEQARKDQAELKRLLREAKKQGALDKAKIVSAKKADRAPMKMALVEAVAIYPFLYAKSDPGYKKSTTLVRKTWVQIESEAGIPAPSRMWNSIKTVAIKE